MSTTIDERVVEMKFDNKQFESNVKTSLSTISDLKKGLDLTGAAKGLENVGSAAKGIDMSALAGAAETVRLKFSALEIMAITALSNITNSALNAGKRIASALTIDPIKTGFQEYETQINAVQTILANTSSKGTTLTQVNNALDQLNTYADKTIYNFTEMTRNIGTFTAAGVELKTSVEAIKGIANLAAVSGSTSQQASTAMYQLSQALSSGTVKLMDWNSVVNAGMGGQVFQDSLKETARIHNVQIDAMIDKEGSFRETLSNGWLTSEILTETLSKFTGDLSDAQLKQMGYTSEQITEIMKLGTMANDAATKVKTFTELLDTLKEAVQSGWGQSWKIIIGNFGEAKEVFTEISNTLGGLIGESADARNAMLSGGLSSGWNQFLREGIPDEEAYKDALKSVATEHGLALEDMIKKEGSFEATLKSGWLTSDIMSQSLEKLTNKTKGLSDEQLEGLGYTRAQINSLEDLNDAVRYGSISMDEFSEKMIKDSGRDNIIQALRNSFEGLISVVKPVKEAFREIFPAYTGNQLYKLTERIKELTAGFKLSEERSDKLKRTFKGVFAIASIVKQAFTAIVKAIFPLFNGMGTLTDGILGVTASWGDWLVSIDSTIKKSDIFNKVMQNLVGFIKIGFETAKNYITPVVEGIVEFINTLKENFKFPGFELFHGFLERIHERMSGIGESAGDMNFGVQSAFNAMGEALANSKLVKVLEAVWDLITTIAGGIASALGGLIGGLVDTLGNANFDGFLDLITGLSLGGIAIAITKFMSSITKPLEGLQGMMGQITGILDSVRGCFKAYQQQLKAKTLMTIAGAIALLTASILVISLIDSDKLASSLAAITVLFANLMGSMSIFSKISGTMGKTAKAAAAMILMSVAVSILAGAMKKLGDLEWDEVAKGIVSIMSLSAIVVASSKLLSMGSGQIVKGTTSLVIFAVAIKILASACKDLAALSWDQIKKGLVGVGILLLEISVFLRIAKFGGKTISTAVGIVVLASAIKIMASACKDFGELDTEVIKKGLASMGLVLIGIATFTKYTGNAKHVISTGIALIAIGAAMKILASALKDFGELEVETIKKGLLGMAGSLLAISVAVNLMPKNMIGIGLGLIAVSTALLILSKAMESMGSMSVDGIKKSLVTLGGSLAILAIGLNFMTGTLAGSAALLVAVAALAVLVPILSILGAMSWEGIAKGLVAIAGAFAVIGIAGIVLTPLIPTILALAGAFALVGLGVVGIGIGLLAAGAGLSAIAIGFTALAAAGIAGATAVVAALTVIITGVAGLIPVVVTKIGEAIIAFCKVITAGAPAIVEAVVTIIVSVVQGLVKTVPIVVDGLLELLTKALISLAKYTPQLVQSLFDILIGVLEGVAKNIPKLIKVAIDVLMAFFEGVVDALTGIDTKTLIKGIAGIGLLSGLMLALAAVATLIPGAMLGVLGMGVVIAELALVLAAIGALAQIPGLSWLINEGAELLGDIGNAIGSFIGGIIGGVMGQVSSHLGAMGNDLSDFMTNIQPFIEGAKNIDASALNGVKALAETILLLTAANILDGLTSWFTGGSSMSKFGKELAEFAPYFKEYYGYVKDIKGSVVESSSNAAKSLAAFAAVIPNSGGLASWISGENSLSAFAKELAEFGPILKSYAESVDGLKGSVVVNSANAAKALAAMAANLPKFGGMSSWFTGEQSLSVFGAELAEFGPMLQKYATSVEGLKSNVVLNSANAALVLAKMAETLPSQGGMLEWFTGEQSLSVFGAELVKFGPLLQEYATSISGIKSSVVSNSANAALALAELAAKLPDTGGLKAWFSGDNDIASFGKKLVSFGNSLSSYYDSVSAIKCDQLSKVVVEFKKLVDLAKGLATTDTSGLSYFSDHLTVLGEAGITSFIQAFTDASAKVTSSATTMIDTFITGVESKKIELNTEFTNIVNSAITTINTMKPDFQEAGMALVTQLLTGVLAKNESVKTAFTSLLSSVVNSIKDKYGQFYSAASYMVDGFVAGINDNIYKAAAMSSAMASAAATAARKELDEHSPSKVFRAIGNYAGIGFVDALGSYVSKAYDAGTNVAEAAKTGIGGAISKITDMINSDMDVQPTIRPVLDLSNITEGTGKLNALFSRNQAIGISSEIAKAKATEIQNGSTPSTTSQSYQYTQINNSPKALSRIEIYRQTKNQLSSMERAVRV